MAPLFKILLVVIMTAVDNALLAGILMPASLNRVRKRVIVAVGCLLAMAQIMAAASVDRLLHHLGFQILSSLLLAWMALRLLASDTHDDPGRSPSLYIWPICRLFLLTFIGNLDNIIWLGSTLQGNRLWLIAWSLASIPVFVAASLYLAKQAERQVWILPLGAVMMAWAAASIVVELPTVKSMIDSLDDIPPTTLQCIVTLVIFGIGLLLRAIAGKGKPRA
ncbi:hypothetical protein C7445_11235 [Alicyclobacillus sacchari]|uniref:Uncharacterized protein n=1 Tax=Alicyclobacillus sacchari TaxID=392010 RepID=A0A4R8LKZ3_9BACL|nr:hypothetical protein [Alicyclobacillus sacchari]TDY43052.1 hypothetical protein C7445_11235 [Alicyclobacillus sacchari]GMA57777.1 hypothetical protein GCM10025858_22800 [Alicyclobacillus sacchari]